MVDSVKNYGITGVGANVELGKQGPRIDASDATVIDLKDKDGNLTVATIAEGVDPEHAVALSQLTVADQNKFNYRTFEVAYDSSTIALANAAANTYIHSVTAEKTASNWVGADANTTITVGDSGDNARLFTGFDPTVQNTDESDFIYKYETTINAYVTQGGASSGNAYITLFYSGTLTDPPAPSANVVTQYLIVAGGGGGGNAYDQAGGGGGGAGMVLTGNTTLTAGTTYNIVVGAGGTGGSDVRSSSPGTAGSDSSFAGITALGGGRGYGSRANTTIYGYKQVGSTSAATGGGGGAGGAHGKGGGGAGGSASDNYDIGSPGAGLTSSITGTNRVYGVGGAGGTAGPPTTNGSNGTANRGHGGDGGKSASSDSAAGGTGGSGVVVVRYADSEANATATGSYTYSQTGGYRIYTFTGDGSLTL